MGQNRHWTESETEYLKDAWGNISKKSISLHLNRSINAITIRAQRIGLGSFFNNSCKYVTQNNLCKLLGFAGGSGYKTISWIKNRNLPTHKITRDKKVFEVVYLDEFWKWADKNKTFLNFSKFEKYSLGPEPKWVDVKRRQDVNLSFKYIATPWTIVEDERLKLLLKKQKYGYLELSKMLCRTCGAIQRRICDLNIKERPVKAYNHNMWTREEYNILCEMIKSGCKYEQISEVIDRSTKAIRGRVFDMYITENLDKVRKYIGNGSWGDNRPDLRLRYKRLMSLKEKVIAEDLLSSLAFRIKEYAKAKSDVGEGYKLYWQKDMCENWNDILGCTAGEKDCDSCVSFVRIKPQYCKQCGATFYERKSNDFCNGCRQQRKKQGYKHYIRCVQKRVAG